MVLILTGLILCSFVSVGLSDGKSSYIFKKLNNFMEIFINIVIKSESETGIEAKLIYSRKKCVFFY